jgi:transitional endoplasmic reticulum ATPase
VCATNFVDLIDPAVLQPGRFDLLIGIGPPEIAALTALWSPALLSHDGDVTVLGGRSRGFTPGDSAERVHLADLEPALSRTGPSISP